MKSLKDLKDSISIKNVKLAFVILIIMLFVVFLLYYYLIFSNILNKNQFANQMLNIFDENENSIFRVQKILTYNSATAIDNSQDNSLQNMSIYQFSDISIYIDNLSYISDLTDENTVKELYIDNIVISSDKDIGMKCLNYKNPLNFGKYKYIEAPKNNRIDFNIINTNSQNENTDYSAPTFYTDCSNPIALGYLNKDILTNYSVSNDSSSVSFNGKILKEANIAIEDINYTLNFRINIVNNLNQKFYYNMSLKIDMSDENGGIYNGCTYNSNNTSGDEYRFFKSFS